MRKDWQFIEEVVMEVKEMMGACVKVECRKVIKNNDNEVHGITIMMPGESICPTIYIENFDNDDPNEVAKKIIETYERSLENNTIPELDVEMVKHFSYVKDKLSIRLVNYENNKEFLKNVPYIKFLDLVIICYINIFDEGIIKVTNDLLDNYGVSKKKLFDIAKENTMKILPVYGENMESVIEKLMRGEISEGKGLAPFLPGDMMYVLSNEKKNFGAAAIIYEDVLKNLSEQIQDDLLILPSSVHEVILLPYKNTTADVINMVYEINRSDALNPEDVLSDTVYLYRRDTEMIERADLEE